MSKLTREELEFEQAMCLLTDKVAELFDLKEKGLIDIEFFILKFINSFDLSEYEKIGILDAAKIHLADIDNLADAEEEDDEEDP